MITPADSDFHVHEPKVANWTETIAFAFSVPEEKILGNIYVLARPNVGAAISSVCIHQGFCTDSFQIDFSDPQVHAPCPDNFTKFTLSSGMSVEATKAPTDYRVAYSSLSGTCDLELDFRGVMPAWDVHDPADNPMIAAGDTGLGDAWANGHYDLIGNVTGRLNLRGKTYYIDCYAGMDHSWGPRVELGTTAITYLHVLFGDDYGLHLVLSLDIIDGQVVYGPFRFGYVVDDGEVFGITDATMSASHIGMLPATNHIRATDARGKVHEFFGTAVGGAPWHSFIPAYVSYQSLMRYQLGDRIGYAMQADCIGLEFLAERMSRHGLGAKRT